jgi:hypothetical protein
MCNDTTHEMLKITPKMPHCEPVKEPTPGWELTEARSRKKIYEAKPVA